MRQRTDAARPGGLQGRMNAGHPPFPKQDPAPEAAARAPLHNQPAGAAAPNTAPLWATSAEGLGPDTRPAELDGLGLHLRQCTAVHARLDALQCSLLRLGAWVQGRRVSSVAVLALLAAAALLLLAPGAP